MKLHWFLSRNGVEEHSLCQSFGDVPLIGQTVYLHDYSTVPPSGRKKYKVIRVDRSITLSKLDSSTVEIPEAKSVIEKLDLIAKNRESYIMEIRGTILSLSSDEAQITVEEYKREPLKIPT